MKKVIAMILVFAMLVPLSSAVAADEMSAKPTVEEILDEYHRKAFEREMQGDTETASTWSRRGGSAKTLEEETVETLTNAGYEAYNVTAENYDTLEAQLYTDFSQMGLDPNGSYIVVISGEDGETSGNSAGANSRARPEIDIEGPPDGGASSFSYTYNGQSYFMRYATVTSDTLREGGSYTEKDVDRFAYMLENLFTTGLVALGDAIEDKIPFGTTASLLLDRPDDYVYVELSVNDFSIISYSRWVCEYIQVWDEENQEWVTSQMSEYVTSSAFGAGFVGIPGTITEVATATEAVTRNSFSTLFFDLEKRKAEAMKAYDRYTIYTDCVDRIEFYMGDENGEIIYETEEGSIAEPLFVHKRKTTMVLPD